MRKARRIVRVGEMDANRHLACGDPKTNKETTES